MGRDASYRIFRNCSPDDGEDDGGYEDIEYLSEVFSNRGSGLPYDESFTRKELIDYIGSLTEDLVDSDEVYSTSKQISILAAILSKMNEGDAVRVKNM